MTKLKCFEKDGKECKQNLQKHNFILRDSTDRRFNKGSNSNEKPVKQVVMRNKQNEIFMLKTFWEKA